MKVKMQEQEAENFPSFTANRRNVSRPGERGRQMNTEVAERRDTFNGRAGNIEWGERVKGGSRFASKEDIFGFRGIEVKKTRREPG